MTSRLMLSLKETTVESSVPWSIATLTDPGRGTTPGPVHTTSRAHGGLHGISETPTLPDGGDIELEHMPPLPQDRGL